MTVSMLAKTQALSHTVRCGDTFLEDRVARSIKAQAYLAHGPATSQISGNSHKYLDMFSNTYVYTCSLQCVNGGRLEANICHQRNGL